MAIGLARTALRPGTPSLGTPVGGAVVRRGTSHQG